MSELVVGDVIQVNNEFTFQGDANLYSWYLQCGDVIDSGAMDADMEEFGGLREDAWVPIHDPNVNFACISWRRLWPQKALPMVVATGTIGSFTPDEGPLPGQCSLVITLYGDVDDPNRNNRGRDFMTGLDGAAQTNGVWDFGVLAQARKFVTLYALMGSTFVAFDSGNLYRIGLFSMTQANKTIPQGDPPVIEDADAVYFWPLEKVRGRSLVRTQRRRAAQDPCEVIFDEDVPVTPL